MASLRVVDGLGMVRMREHKPRALQKLRVLVSLGAQTSPLRTQDYVISSDSSGDSRDRQVGLALAEGKLSTLGLASPHREVVTLRKSSATTRTSSGYRDAHYRSGLQRFV